MTFKGYRKVYIGVDEFKSQQVYELENGSFTYSPLLNADKPAYLVWLNEGNSDLEVIEYEAPPQPTDDEKWQRIKDQRTIILLETDWTQLLDCPLEAEKIEEFKTYRQTLRDIPQDFENPDDVVWPEKPL